MLNSIDKKNAIYWNVIYVIISFFVSSVAFSETLTWRINKDHSELLFDVDYLKVAKVQGRFERFKGEVKFDEDLELINEINISIMSKSISTSNKMRDKHLRSTPFLNSDQYPLITFKSTSITVAGPNKYVAQGVLKIKEIQKKMTFAFSLSENKEDTWRYKNRFVFFSGELDRHNWGLEWDKTIAEGDYLVGNLIRINGQFQIQPFNALTPASMHMIPDTKKIRMRERQNRGELSKNDEITFSETADNLEESTETPTQETVEEEQPLSMAMQTNSEITSREVNPLWWAAYVSSCLLSVGGVCLYTDFGRKMFKSLRPSSRAEKEEISRLLRFLSYPMIILYIAAMIFIGFGSKL
tara:strand:+ start:601 stop:1662 length:1062 start_codon:yes stop_codon:yes gene_type:complete